MLPGFDLEQILLSGGAMLALFALFVIIFAESGLFFGFFLPGDSLLLAAGVISAANPETFPLWAVCVVCFIAAVMGDAVGYGFGHRYGRRLYARPDSRFFKQTPSSRRRGVLREARRQDHRHRPLHALRADVRADRGRRRCDAIPPLRRLQLHRRRAVGDRPAGGRLRVGQHHPARDSRPLADRHPGHRRGAFAAAHVHPWLSQQSRGDPRSRPFARSEGAVRPLSEEPPS